MAPAELWVSRPTRPDSETLQQRTQLSFVAPVNRQHPEPVRHVCSVFSQHAFNLVCSSHCLFIAGRLVGRNRFRHSDEWGEDPEIKAGLKGGVLPKLSLRSAWVVAGQLFGARTLPVAGRSNTIRWAMQIWNLCDCSGHFQVEGCMWALQIQKGVVNPELLCSLIFAREADRGKFIKELGKYTPSGKCPLPIFAFALSRFCSLHRELGGLVRIARSLVLLCAVLVEEALLGSHRSFLLPEAPEGASVLSSGPTVWRILSCAVVRRASQSWCVVE